MTIALIVAAGAGLRLAGKVKKQYLDLDGHPILSHTLRAFDTCPSVDAVFLVLPETDADFCRRQILAPLEPRKPITLASGGPTRQASVYNGLLAIAEENPECENDIVVIHDGVRPFVTADQIDACIDGARSSGACILGVPAGDTVKRVDTSGYIDTTLEREEIWLAQTPQAFRYGLVLKAHRDARQCDYQATDDASLVERLGEPVKIIRGSRNNLKITRPEDLAMSNAIRRSLFE